MSEDSKKMYILVERANGLTSGVSRALWPAAVRRIVATGRSAQRRRARLMKRRRYVRVDIPPRLFLCALVASSMLSGGTLVLAALWRLWYLPVLAAVPLALLVLSLAARRPAAGLPPVPLSQQTILETGPIPPSLPWKSLPGLSSLSSLTGSLAGSPETPMPDPPSLVRVLETFDLSRGEGEACLLAGGADGAATAGSATGLPLPLSRFAELRVVEGEANADFAGESSVEEPEQEEDLPPLFS